MLKNCISFQPKNNKVTANLIWNRPHKPFIGKQQTAWMRDPGQKLSGMTPNFITTIPSVTLNLFQGLAQRIKQGNLLYKLRLRLDAESASRTRSSSARPLWGKSGFTLIELLVVVLIIGILAAVALPQYQKTVKKAKYMQSVTMCRSFVTAQEAYYLANGTYTQDIHALDIGLSFDEMQENNGSTLYTFNGDYVVRFYDDGILCSHNEHGTQTMDAPRFWTLYAHAPARTGDYPSQPGKTYCYGDDLFCQSLGKFAFQGFYEITL